MEILILGTILLLRVVQNISGKSCSTRLPSEPRGVIAYMGIRMGLSAATALVALVLGGVTIDNIVTLPKLGWIIAFGTGLSLTISCICSLLAMRGASVVLVSLFGTAGLLIPTLFGIYLYNQLVSGGQWLGIVCLLIAAILLSSASTQSNGKITTSTFFLLCGCMFANGGTMLLQSLYRTYVPTGSVSLFSFLQFGIPSVIMVLTAFIWSERTKQSYPKMEKKLLVYTFFAAAAVFGISQISTIASAMIPVAVLFPISDGGSTVIAAIVAAVCFKEKLTIRSIAGVFVGVIGIMMIKLLSGS